MSIPKSRRKKIAGATGLVAAAIVPLSLLGAGPAAAANPCTVTNVNNSANTVTVTCSRTGGRVQASVQCLSLATHYTAWVPAARTQKLSYEHCGVGTLGWGVVWRA